MTDAATVSGGAGQPTGTVDFFLCQPNEVTVGGCEGSAGTKVGATKTLNGSGQATSDASTNTTAVGTYCWRAVYSGDTVYIGGSHTNSTSECFTVGKKTPVLATTSSPTGGDVVPGTSATDSFTASAPAEGLPAPTGTVDFFLCQPNEVTAGGCEGSAGTKVGATQALVSGAATSDASTNTTAVGTYCWRAVYSGDTVYTDGSHTNSTSECFTTVKQPSTTATQASTNATDVVPGSSVKDAATVTGIQGGPTPTGTVDFFLCQPNEVTAGGCEGSAGTKVGVTKALVDGAATSDASANTTAVGKYCWRAVYSGDTFYNGSNHTNAVSECFTVAAVPPPPPPPPPPPAPKTDVAIQKDATAQVTLGSNGQATIVYDFAVKNNGPDPAANVTVADPAPSGVTFASVAQQPSQGSCSIQSGGALLACSIGTLAVGQSVAIKVNATVTQTGTITNTGTTTTTTPETNTANNTDSAQTLVVAPVKPPVKPPVVAPEICNTVTVAPKTLKTAKTGKIVVKVTQGKKAVAGAKIKITGPGISKTVTYRQERQGHRDRQADQAGHRPDRDPEQEGL